MKVEHWLADEYTDASMICKSLKDANIDVIA